MREDTDQEICQIIQDYDRIIQELRYGVEAFVRELVSLDSNDDWLCSLLALQHSGTGSATTHSSLHDLSDLLKNKNFKRAACRAGEKIQKKQSSAIRLAANLGQAPAPLKTKHEKANQKKQNQNYLPEH